MTSRRQIPPKLHLPGPTCNPSFPLSSPISEEIFTPLSEDLFTPTVEDKDLERSRPFEFLSQATKQKAEPKAEAARDRIRIPSFSHRDRYAPDKRTSIGEIGKKKKNGGKLPGLNVITDFSSRSTSKKQSSEELNAPFVDLNDLKQLSKKRGQERSAQAAPELTEAPLASNTSQKGSTQLFRQLPEQTRQLQYGNPFLDPNPFADRHGLGLSPSDRHVMIGLSVPAHESEERAKEHDTGNTPLTPTIVVTPACTDVAVTPARTEFALSPTYSEFVQGPVGGNIVLSLGHSENSMSATVLETGRPRATSSIYSQPTPRQTAYDIPPVPAIPVEHIPASQQSLANDFLNAHLAAMTSKRQSTSAETIIEDYSPVGEQDHHTLTEEDDDKAPLAGLSVNTAATRPESQGWWNVLLSPLLSKKSPASPSFPRDGTSATTPAKDTGKDWWEKTLSMASFKSPGAGSPSQSNEGEKSMEQSRSLGDTSTTQPTQRQAIPSMMYHGQPIQGEAAEYYQACAHELFSRTPYFECTSHICSITPTHSTMASATADLGETRDRSLILGKVEEPRHTAQGGRGILIDVDTPAEQTEKHLCDSKEVPKSHSSRNSVDSWESHLSYDFDTDHNASSPEEPRGRAKEHAPELPIERSLPEPLPSAPVPMPAPSPQYYPQPAPVPQSAPAPQSISISNPITISQPAPAPQPFASFEPPAPISQPVSAPEPAPAPQTGFEAPTSYREPPVDVTPQEQPRALNEWPKMQHEAPFGANEPISPAFQRAAGGPRSIPMSSMKESSSTREASSMTEGPVSTLSAPTPAYTQYPRGDEASLPANYTGYYDPNAVVMNPTGVAGPGEAQRQRLEREDAMGRKIGGLWRGRGCIPKKGCFGRPGREGRLRRRWYFAIALFFIIILTVAIVVPLTVTAKGSSSVEQSQWLNLTSFPPIVTGISTVVGAETIVSKSTCVSPSSLWSCALPKDAQADNTPYAGNEPSFRLQIQFRNETTGNTTYTTTNSKRDSWDPSPSAPTLANQKFLGNTTDGNSQPYAGEETPFYISMLSASKPLYRRSSTDNSSSSDSDTSNSTFQFPSPLMNSDGTAAAATLYPLPDTQPMRLYNRGEDDEHYGFYTYYDKSIFLASRAPLEDSAKDDNTLDQNGGSSESDARTRCTWSQTRFLVQIWTKPEKKGYALQSSGTSTSTSAAATATATATAATQPGSFPWPVTFTVDRHGGDWKKKMVYCYGIDEDQHYNTTDRKLNPEYRGYGGTLIDPAPGPLSGSDASGNSSFDGGSGGCQCQWANWISTA
ncbi:hypothetical protein N7462_000751 [Penicillium macrosclerotiorum]|uniref:uncharacterized protein n=1 Tax=Penicillium macrosclerotiorum TaxID=303699 RepID=UPI002548259D|nr:uncharacterized protein N7462_000751 [Penicillium macrosclerotiorum]KAJ5698746.1 hypothetical protein N7462_000751 [Penicillium macrosclerotiorum]